MTYEEELNQKLYQGIIRISHYCRTHDCNTSCNFFLVNQGCALRSGKPPSTWIVPATIIKSMNCEEYKPIIIEEEHKNESIKEGDKNGSQ